MLSAYIVARAVLLNRTSRVRATLCSPYRHLFLLRASLFTSSSGRALSTLGLMNLPSTARTAAMRCPTKPEQLDNSPASFLLEHLLSLPFKNPKQLYLNIRQALTFKFLESPRSVECRSHGRAHQHRDVVVGLEVRVTCRIQKS